MQYVQQRYPVTTMSEMQFSPSIQRMVELPSRHHKPMFSASLSAKKNGGMFPKCVVEEASDNFNKIPSRKESFVPQSNEENRFAIKGMRAKGNSGLAPYSSLFSEGSKRIQHSVQSTTDSVAASTSTSIISPSKDHTQSKDNLHANSSHADNLKNHKTNSPIRQDTSNSASSYHNPNTSSNNSISSGKVYKSFRRNRSSSMAVAAAAILTVEGTRDTNERMQYDDQIPLKAQLVSETQLPDQCVIRKGSLPEKSRREVASRVICIKKHPGWLKYKGNQDISILTSQPIYRGGLYAQGKEMEAIFKSSTSAHSTRKLNSTPNTNSSSNQAKNSRQIKTNLEEDESNYEQLIGLNTNHNNSCVNIIVAPAPEEVINPVTVTPKKIVVVSRLRMKTCSDIESNTSLIGTGAHVGAASASAAAAAASSIQTGISIDHRDTHEEEDDTGVSNQWQMLNQNARIATAQRGKVLQVQLRKRVNSMQDYQSKQQAPFELAVSFQATGLKESGSLVHQNSFLHRNQGIASSDEAIKRFKERKIIGAGFLQNPSHAPTHQKSSLISKSNRNQIQKGVDLFALGSKAIQSRSPLLNVKENSGFQK